MSRISSPDKFSTAASMNASIASSKQFQSPSAPTSILKHSSSTPTTPRSRKSNPDDGNLLSLLKKGQLKPNVGKNQKSNLPITLDEYKTMHTINFDNLQINFDDFYAECVENFDKEREFYEHFIQMIEPKNNEKLNLMWFNRSVVDDIRMNELTNEEIQQKVNAIDLEIKNIEREIFEENKNKADRLTRIECLETLGRPVEADVTYVVPERFSRSNAIITASNSPSEEAKNKNTKVKAGSSGGGGEGISGNNSLFRIVKSGDMVQLERKLNQETVKIFSLIQDLNNLIDDCKYEKNYNENKFSDISSKEIKESRQLYETVRENEFQCFYIISELLLLKYRIMIAQREEMEELEQLQIDKEYFVEKEEQLKDQLIKEMNHTKRVLKNELDDCTKEFQRQLNDLNLKIMKLKKKEVELFNRNVKKTKDEERLAEVLEQYKDRYERLKVRCGLEMEGYQTEAKDLRKKLRSLEKIAEKRLIRSPSHHQPHPIYATNTNNTSNSPDAVYPWEKAQFNSNITH